MHNRAGSVRGSPSNRWRKWVRPQCGDKADTACSCGTARSPSPPYSVVGPHTPGRTNGKVQNRTRSISSVELKRKFSYLCKDRWIPSTNQINILNFLIKKQNAIFYNRKFYTYLVRARGPTEIAQFARGFTLSSSDDSHTAVPSEVRSLSLLKHKTDSEITAQCNYKRTQYSQRSCNEFDPFLDCRRRHCSLPPQYDEKGWVRCSTGCWRAVHQIPYWPEAEACGESSANVSIGSHGDGLPKRWYSSDPDYQPRQREAFAVDRRAPNKVCLVAPPICRR